MMVCSRVAVAASLSLCLLTSRLSAEPVGSVEKSDVLRAVLKSFARFASLQLTASFETTMQDAGKPALLSKDDLGIRRDGDRALVSLRTTVFWHGREPANGRKQFVVYDTGDVLEVEAEADSALNVEGNGSELRSVLLFSKRMTGSQEIDARKMYWGLNDVGVGIWVVGYEPIREQLGRADTIAVTRDGAGYLISASGSFGDLSLAVSHASDWLPTQVTLLKSPPDEFMDGTVSSVFSDANDFVKTIRWVVSISGFEGDDASVLPSTFRSVRETVHLSGKVDVIRTGVTLSELDLAPKIGLKDFVPTIPIPVGRKVEVVGAIHLPFEWDGEKPVTTAPELLPSDFLGERHASRRTWLISIMGLLLSMIMGWLYWRFRTRGQD